MNILYTVIIYPLKLIIECFFQFIYSHTANNVVLSLFCISMFVSLVTLPLYNQSDKLQKEETFKQKGLSAWGKHIKKNFHGNEQYMMIQAYYRENGYNPIISL